VALQLRRRGITRVHPLEGGLAAWMALGFPVEDRRPGAAPDALPEADDSVRRARSG
jgi:hypothetical protein